MQLNYICIINLNVHVNLKIKNKHKYSYVHKLKCIYIVLILDFTMEQYNVLESVGYVEIGVMLLRGISTTPITVVVTPTEQSAMGK